MRSFIIATVIFVLVVVFVLCNTFFVKQTINDLFEKCNEIEQATDGRLSEAIDALNDTWKTCRNRISLSVHHSEVDEAEFSLSELTAYQKEGNIDEFSAAFHAFRTALQHIADSQAFSFENIF